MKSRPLLVPLCPVIKPVSAENFGSPYEGVSDLFYCKILNYSKSSFSDSFLRHLLVSLKPSDKYYVYYSGERFQENEEIRFNTSEALCCLINLYDHPDTNSMAGIFDILNTEIGEVFKKLLVTSELTLYAMVDFDNYKKSPKILAFGIGLESMYNPSN